MKKTMTTLITIITILTIFSSASYAVDMRVIGSLRLSEPTELDPERALYRPDSHMPANREDLDRSYLNLPDFKIIDVFITKKSCDAGGFLLDIWIRVENARGDEGLDADTRLKISMNSTLNHPDLAVWMYIPALGPGEVVLVDFLTDWYVPNIVGSVLYAENLEFALDENDVIEEFNEDNNTMTVDPVEEWTVFSPCTN